MSEGGLDMPAELTARLIGELARSIAKSYRIDSETAAKEIAPLLENDRALQRALAEKRNIREVQRMRVFKVAEKAARKHVYTHLRRYKRADSRLAEAVRTLDGLAPGQAAEAAEGAIRTICEAHVSTAERLPSIGAFHKVLAAEAKAATSILDVGAGVFPLLFPFDTCPALDCYLAVDKDAVAMRAVRAFARWRGGSLLQALEWSISEGWDPVMRAGRVEFDLALLSKLVPVVARQEPHLLPVLAKTPARKLLITGSKEALAKRQVIMHRERGCIMSFIEDYGLTLDARFETVDEIGFIVSR